MSQINLPKYYGILILTVVGFILRLVHIHEYSFWMDEGYTIVISTEFSFSEMIWVVLTADNHPPLYYIFMKLWFLIFPVNEISARNPSLIFGSLCIPGIFMLGKEISNEKTGYIAAFFLTFSAFHIRYSQEARMYSILTFFSIVAAYYFVKYIDGNHDVLNKFSLLILIALYLHVYSVFLLVAFNAIAYLQDKFNHDWIKHNSIIVSLYLPYVYFAIYRYFSIKNGFWIAKPNMTDIYFAVISYFYSADLMNLLLVMVIVNAIAVKHSELNSKNIQIVFVPVLFVLIVPYLFSYYFTPIFVDKYAIASSVFIFIGFGSIIQMTGKLRHMNLAFLLMFLLIVTPTISSLYSAGTYDNFKGAMDYIDAHAEPNQIMILNRGGLIINYLVDYYLDSNVTKMDYPVNTDPNGYRNSWDAQVNEDNAPLLLDYVDGYWGIWLVYIRRSDYYNLLLQALASKYVQVDHQYFSGIELYLFKIPE